MSPKTLLRIRAPHEDSRVAFVELFFDLVLVFAVTQLSHGLLHHFTPTGLVQKAILTLAVWWVWVYTTWAPTWLEPQRKPVRTEEGCGGKEGVSTCRYRRWTS